MYPINGKSFYDESIYRAAQAERAKVLGALIRKAASGVKALVNRLVVDPIKARALRNRQFDELMNMDDHMLRDLGLSRGGINYAFEHGREADPALANAANTNVPARTSPRAA